MAIGSNESTLEYIQTDVRCPSQCFEVPDNFRREIHLL